MSLSDNTAKINTLLSLIQSLDDSSSEESEETEGETENAPSEGA